VPVEGLIAELREQGVLLDEVNLDSAVRDGALRTLPGAHGCDGFYAVVLERGRLSIGEGDVDGIAFDDAMTGRG
jgi:hypothetical protein